MKVKTVRVSGEMPEFSGKYSFGDTSAVTRFVIGLDEARRIPWR